jgi:hypothetical protein
MSLRKISLQNYWLWELCPSSSILTNTKGHNVPENESVFFLTWETPTLLHPLEKANLSQSD